MERYALINNKRKREIVLLRGRGCAYRKCAFCDYYLDSGKNVDENFAINSKALERVSGVFGELEVINSGSVFELDSRTLSALKYICKEKKINTLHFESHYLYRDRIADLRKEFSGFDLKIKLGLETFDYDLREKVLKKGIKEKDPAVISEHFDEADFLFGIKGQNVQSMMSDIESGLKYFERICVNIMCENSTSITPDKDVIYKFKSEIYPRYKDDWRVDILINNTDFGVGE